jgi:beta-mannanase
LKRLLLGLGCGLAAIAAVNFQSPALAEMVVPKKARAMTGVELYEIFHGKTWKWTNGAGRMEGKGRRFRAWTQSGAEASWAEGRWIVRDDGQLCLKADWHTQSATSRNTTCFSHRTLGGTIYQRREPAGEWYVFKHSKTAKTDEFNKLVSEDLVKAKLSIIQDLVSSQTVQSDKNRLEAQTVGAGKGREQIGVSTTTPLDKRPILIKKSIDFGAYDPHGDFNERSSSKIEHLFLAWEDVDLSTLALADDYAKARGRSLMITIEPWSWSPEWRLSPQELLNSILSGARDANMAAVCSTAATLKSPVIIRWGQEMDETDNQFSWSHWRAQDYAAAYRRMVKICRTHLKTAKYIWSPKGNDGLKAFYPGDDVVDFVGLSVFGLQKYDREKVGRDQTFAERLAPGYARVKGFGKPIIVAELGYDGDASYVRSWAESVTKPHAEFPALTAVVYFNDREIYEWPQGYGRPDWRVIQEAVN